MSGAFVWFYCDSSITRISSISISLSPLLRMTSHPPCLSGKALPSEPSVPVTSLSGPAENWDTVEMDESILIYSFLVLGSKNGILFLMPEKQTPFVSLLFYFYFFFSWPHLHVSGIMSHPLKDHTA